MTGIHAMHSALGGGCTGLCRVSLYALHQGLDVTCMVSCRGGEKGCRAAGSWHDFQHIRVRQFCHLALHGEGSAERVCWNLQVCNFFAMAADAYAHFHTTCLHKPSCSNDFCWRMHAFLEQADSSTLSSRKFNTHKTTILYFAGWCTGRRCCW